MEGEHLKRARTPHHRKLKILIVCKALPNTFKGGIQTHVWALSRWLLRFGHQVTILTGGSWRRGLHHREEGGRQIVELPYAPGRYLPLIPTFAEEWSFNWEVGRWLRRHARSYDIVHFQGRSGYLAAGLRNAPPRLTTVHSLAATELKWYKEEIKNGLDRWFYSRITPRLERRMLCRSTALIAVSGEVANRIRQFIGTEVPVMHRVYNGVDPQPFAAPAGSAPILLFVGRLSRIKGVFPLIESMQQVDDSIVLHMIGEGPARPALEQRIRQLGLVGRVRLFGAQPGEEVMRRINECRALILPSFQEAQGIVLLEANSCGRPVLASAITGIKEVVQDGKNGLLFSPGDTVEMADRINWLFRHPGEARRMGEWGRKHIEQHYTWESIARQTERIYTALIP